jgi:accessory gene regulator protein AgrB
MFYVSFATSCIIGVLVTHASFNLTRTTSALTCSVTGSIKSIALSLLGALAFSDFKYNLYNVVGLAVSMAGAGWYAAVAGKSA